MFGKNPKRPPVKGDGSVLAVKNIFKTIQGEGLHVGVPAIFLRLGGCNLACEFCDTEFEGYEDLAMAKILAKIDNLSLNDKSVRTVHLVVITGGEPFRQPIGALCSALLDVGFLVQIETNGSIYSPVPEEVDIICSPKVSNGKYLSIREDLLPKVAALKFLISANLKGYDGVPELGQTRYKIPVFVQPMDEYNPALNAKNDKMAVDLAINNGYRLSYQIHKKLGIE